MTQALRTNDFTVTLPLIAGPLVHCITNEVTCETVANALLYLGAKPIMADDAREFGELFQQTNSLLLNLGRLSPTRESNLLAASRLANVTGKPTVVDLVGVSATSHRFELSQKLATNQPAVIKGNTSELRAFCQLATSGRGVDGSPTDQTETALVELTHALQAHAQRYPETVFLATGATDIIVSQNMSIKLTNGVAALDRFTGSGDVVGALIAAFLGAGEGAFDACVSAVTYFNRCGELAWAELATPKGLAAFRQGTLNQLSLLLAQANWADERKGWYA